MLGGQLVQPLFGVTTDQASQPGAWVVALVQRRKRSRSPDQAPYWPAAQGTGPVSRWGWHVELPRHVALTVSHADHVGVAVGDEHEEVRDC